MVIVGAVIRICMWSSQLYRWTVSQVERGDYNPLSYTFGSKTVVLDRWVRIPDLGY